jgi:hypothetical protein
MKQYSKPTSYVQNTETEKGETKKDDSDDQSASAALMEQKKLVDDLDSQITKAEKHLHIPNDKLNDEEVSDLLMGESNLI